MPEPLRLGMTLTDEVSGTLGKIEQNLKNMARTTEREFRALNRSFEGVGGSIRQIITPALEAFGVSSLTLTGVVGGLYSELSKLAVKSEEMKYSSDWTRLSMERLNRLQNLTNIFGRSLGNLAEDTKTIGNLGFHLTQGFTTDFIRGLHANFRDAGVEKEFHELVGKQGDALLDAIQHILEGKTVRQQQKITQMLHLSQDAARRIMDEALAKKLHIKLDFAVDPEKAEKFHEQQLRLSGHIAELSTDIKNKLFAPFTDWTKELNTWIGAHQKGIESGVVRFFHGLGKAMHETYDAWVLVKPALEKMMEYMNVQKFAEGQAEGKDLTFEGSVQKNWERLQQLWGNVKEEVLENFRAPQQFGEGGGGFAGIRMDPGWQGREPSPGTIEDRRNENPQFAFSPEKPIEEGTRKGITAGLLDYLGPRKREN